MALNLIKKNIVVGVSVTPEFGLELAQVDFLNKKVLKYASTKMAYDNIRKEIADLDTLKESLKDLFDELAIPKGSEVVLNLPTVAFGVSNYPASLNEAQVIADIEEQLATNPIFRDDSPSISATVLDNSTIQFNRIAYTALQRTSLIEIVLQIKELGYKLLAIDTSVSSTLNALIYNERVNARPDFSWVLMLVDEGCCRLISMFGQSYVDCFEEFISIGEVLGDAENYSTVLNAVKPILKNLPSECLYVVSKTSLISAKVLADQLTYGSQIIHQDISKISSEQFLEVDESISPEIASQISLDVIGASIYREINKNSLVKLNLYNEYLGDIYFLEQPPVLKIGSYSIVMSMENMVIASIVAAIIIISITFLALMPIGVMISKNKGKAQQIDMDIKRIQKFIDENSEFSGDVFNEGDEIRLGLVHNKNVFSYFTIMGTEIPKKLWLTKLELGEYITVEGQADNLESIYSFFRNVKDYNPSNNIKLQKLELAKKSNLTKIDEASFDTDSIISSLNADFYEFRISNAPEVVKKDVKPGVPAGLAGLPELEDIE